MGMCMGMLIDLRARKYSRVPVSMAPAPCRFRSLPHAPKTLIVTLGCVLDSGNPKIASAWLDPISLGADSGLLRRPSHALLSEHACMRARRYA